MIQKKFVRGELHLKATLIQPVLRIFNGPLEDSHTAVSFNAVTNKNCYPLQCVMVTLFPLLKCSH